MPKGLSEKWFVRLINLENRVVWQADVLREIRDAGDWYRSALEIDTHAGNDGEDLLRKIEQLVGPKADPDKKELLMQELEALHRVEEHWNDYNKKQGVYKHEKVAD